MHDILMAKFHDGQSEQLDPPIRSSIMIKTSANEDRFALVSSVDLPLPVRYW